METQNPILPRSLIASWTDTPIPNLSLSAGALLALADLQTIAQRTVLTGGSSWLDALVLAPGLHYQQAADALDRAGGSEATAIESHGPTGQEERYVISNAAMLGYLRRVCSESHDEPVTLDVVLEKAGKAVKRRMTDFLRIATGEEEIDWLSHLLYLASPLLTAAALAFMIILEDWWALASLLALMLSRLFNIYIIKERSRPVVAPVAPAPPGAEDSVTEYAIDLGHGRHIRLRGRPADLQAMTTQVWLRNKTHIEGFFEAGAKLIVYLVAAFSGNLSQAGAMIFMALLLVSAGLLGLSNAHLKGFRMHGRIARLEKRKAIGKPGKGTAAAATDRRVTV